jgi:hypothetical protein
VPGSGSGLGDGDGDGDGSGDGEKVSTDDGEEGLGGGAGGWPLHAPATRATAMARVQLRMSPMVSADRRLTGSARRMPACPSEARDPYPTRK